MSVIRWITLSAVSGIKCIAVKRQWFTPPEFERFAGKQSYKNWKMSIRCMATPLGKLVQVCREGIFILKYMALLVFLQHLLCWCAWLDHCTPG